jgi:hypothetical protein
MLQKKSEIEHKKVPLPCGLVVAPFDKLRAGLARRLN